LILSILVDNIVLILMVVFLVLMCIWGRHRGFIRMITSTAAMVISLFLARGFMTKLSARMMEQNSWKIWVETKVLPKLNGIGAETVFNALSFLILFVISLILIRILASVLDRLTEGTPLSVVNEVFGMLLGLVEGMILIWVFMIFVEVMPQFAFCEFVSRQIQAEPILQLVHDNNLVVIFAQSVLEKTPVAIEAETTAVPEILETLETVTNP